MCIYWSCILDGQLKLVVDIVLSWSFAGLVLTKTLGVVRDAIGQTVCISGFQYADDPHIMIISHTYLARVTLQCGFNFNSP